MHRKNASLRSASKKVPVTRLKSDKALVWAEKLTFLWPFRHPKNTTAWGGKPYISLANHAQQYYMPLLVLQTASFRWPIRHRKMMQRKKLHTFEWVLKPKDFSIASHATENHSPSHLAQKKTLTFPLADTHRKIAHREIDLQIMSFPLPIMHWKVIEKLKKNWAGKLSSHWPNTHRKITCLYIELQIVSIRSTEIWNNCNLRLKQNCFCFLWPIMNKKMTHPVIGLKKKGQTFPSRSSTENWHTFWISLKTLMFFVWIMLKEIICIPL